MKRYKIFLAVMFSAVIFLLTACTGVKQKTEEQKAENSMFAMNTFMTFQAYGENAKSALEETKDYIIDLENMRSVTREESDIYTANHSNGAEIVIQKETADLFPLRFKWQNRRTVLSRHPCMLWEEKKLKIIGEIMADLICC
ncbi:hypothetical protein [Luxibacter massiliensis]|uniref:hypothetical protein n=1 Tax=Luxibacter massiliensis TaxID=2219695 RepID=UPI000F05AD9A|nr:hypothetical protein [Luxibacter massiliensis]